MRRRNLVLILSVTLIALLFLGNGSVQAQDKRVLTLDESVNIALRNAFNVKDLTLKLSSQRNLLRWVNLRRRSRVDFNYDLPAFSRTYQEKYNSVTGVNELVDLQTNRVNTYLSIIQPIVSTNTTVQITNSLYRQDQINKAMDVSQKYFYNNFGLRVTQPIFTFNAQKYEEKQTQFSIDRTENLFPYEMQRVLNSVTNSFYNLYSNARMVSIAQDEVNQSERSYNIALNKYRAGIIAEVQALEQEVDLARARNTLRQREGQLKRIQDDFKLLIGLDTDEEIEVVANIEIQAVEIDLNKAIAEALERRHELKNQLLTIEQREMSIREEKGNREFKADIEANLGYNGNSEQFRGAFDDFRESQSISINFQVPIWDWGANGARVERARDNLDIAKLQLEQHRKEIINSVKKSVDEVNEAKDRMEILSKSVDIAQRNYDISLERFNNGDITSTDLAQQLNRLTNAKTEVLNAQITSLNAMAALKLATLWDFENNKPVEIDMDKLLQNE